MKNSNTVFKSVPVAVVSALVGAGIVATGIALSKEENQDKINDSIDTTKVKADKLIKIAQDTQKKVSQV